MLRTLFGTLTLVACACLIPGPADAGGAAPAKKGSPEALFKKLDTNKDGKLSKEEFMKMGKGKTNASSNVGSPGTELEFAL